jgi:hypothetical protein
MTTRNDITGDLIATKGTSDAYRDNYDRIFGKQLDELRHYKVVQPWDKQQLAADIGPEKSQAQEYFEEELALEEMRTKL